MKKKLNPEKKNGFWKTMNWFIGPYKPNERKGEQEMNKVEWRDNQGWRERDYGRYLEEGGCWGDVDIFKVTLSCWDER